MNEQIVDDALADIALHPEHHAQSTWARAGQRPPKLFGIPPVERWCGSVMCLAGFIAIRAGYHMTLDGRYRKPGQESGCQAWTAASRAADMTAAQASEMFQQSADDDLKQLTARWERLTGRTRA